MFSMLVAACGRVGFDTTLGPAGAIAEHATLAAGDGFSCAIREGNVWCWGRADVSQLGVDERAVAQNRRSLSLRDFKSTVRARVQNQKSRAQTP